MSPGPPDTVLIEESLREPEVFAGIFDRHSDEIHRYVSRRLGSDVADDVTASVFLTAFRKRDRYDLSRPDARPWLYGIATRVMAEHRRAERRQVKALARTAAEHTESFDDRAATRLSAAGAGPRLRSALARLSPADRDLLLLIAWAELTYEQAAQALDVPVGTIASRLHRIRKKTQRAFGGIDPTTEFEGSPA